jgi:hypothetical protein
MALTGAPAENFVVNKFGRNSSVGASDETIWTAGSLYVWPGSAQIMVLGSAVNSDIGQVGSLGNYARAVKISGLDSGYLQVDEVVTLDGTSGSNTTTEFIRVNRMEVVSSGTFAKNAGTLYLGNTGTLTAGKPPVVFSLIDSGEGQTRCAFYTSPASYYSHFINYNFSVGGGGNIEGKMYVTRKGDSRNIKVSDETTAGSINKDFALSDEYLPMSDFEMVAFRTSGAAASVSARFDLELHLGSGGGAHH